MQKPMMMKRFFRIKPLLLLACLLADAGTISAQVRFETRSMSELRRMVQESQGLLFIDLYADWCGPCRLMDREVFAREDVGRYMDEHFVCARFDIEREPGRTMARQYGVSAIPTYLIFDAEGRLLVRTSGSRTAKQFLRDLKSVIK